MSVFWALRANEAARRPDFDAMDMKVFASALNAHRELGTCTSNAH